MTDREMISRLIRMHEKHPKLFDDYDRKFASDCRGREEFTSPKARNHARRLLAMVDSDPKHRAAANTDLWNEAKGCDKCLDGIVVLRIADDTKWEASLPRWGEQTRKEHPTDQRFREQAFACTCPKGELKKQWQGFPRSARDAWLEGWRTKDEWEVA